MHSKIKQKKANAAGSLQEAAPASGAAFYRKIYDSHDNRQPIDISQLRRPTKRRQQRILMYRKMVGPGHEAILELGCNEGDLTNALRQQAKMVFGSDISLRYLRTATQREGIENHEKTLSQRIAFVQMHAAEIAFGDRSFDFVVSTSMIEHLLPQDIQPHFREVRRVLKQGGKYLLWCPNRLGHHGDRDVHLSMFSYREMMGELRQAGFGDMQSMLFNRTPFYVDAKWKAWIEDFLVRWQIPILWSHLGVRNILVLAQK